MQASTIRLEQSTLSSLLRGEPECLRACIEQSQRGHLALCLAAIVTDPNDCRLETNPGEINDVLAAGKEAFSHPLG